MILGSSDTSGFLSATKVYRLLGFFAATGIYLGSSPGFTLIAAGTALVADTASG